MGLAVIIGLRSLTANLPERQHIVGLVSIRDSAATCHEGIVESAVRNDANAIGLGIACRFGGVKVAISYVTECDAAGELVVG